MVKIPIVVNRFQKDDRSLGKFHEWDSGFKYQPVNQEDDVLCVVDYRFDRFGLLDHHGFSN